jgi:hypothetical protein
MSDYIPGSDADFSAWLQNFITYANAHIPQLGIIAADITSLQTLGQDFDTAQQTTNTIQAQAKGAVAAEADVRSALEAAVREVVGRIQTHPGVTDEHRNSLGITVRSGTRTPVGPPTSKPVATVDTSNRLQHIVAFVDELTPSSRAKPAGALGCEIWVKVDGPPPADPSELKYLATDTRSPYVAEYDGSQAGKTAYYMLRWVSTRGETGPWSQTIAATITA